MSTSCPVADWSLLQRQKGCFGSHRSDYLPFSARRLMDRLRGSEKWPDTWRTATNELLAHFWPPFVPLQVALSLRASHWQTGQKRAPRTHKKVRAQTTTSARSNDSWRRLRIHLALALSVCLVCFRSLFAQQHEQINLLSPGATGLTTSDDKQEPRPDREAD